MSLKLVLTDLEGTTTALSFVRDTLYPYARAHLADYLRAHPDAPEVRAACAAALAEAPGTAPLLTLSQWMEEDRKHTALKALQGSIWDLGYADGTLQGHLWEDAVEGLQGIAKRGLRIAVFSSGSVAAQQRLFRHSTAGDLSGLICAWFDTHVGAKRDVDAYRRIAQSLGVDANEVLFLSDVTAELDAAADAGMRTCCIERGEAGYPAPHRHPRARDFSELELAN